MDWRDEGILLTARRHGESTAIVEVLTLGARPPRRGGPRRRRTSAGSGAAAGGAPVPGMVGADRGAHRHLSGRSDRRADGGDHGRRRGAGDPRCGDGADRRHPAGARRPSRPLPAEPGTHRGTGHRTRLDRALRRLGVALLAELGFGLDLRTCAVTATPDDLVWVSPRSGRAVSRAAGAPGPTALYRFPRSCVTDGTHRPSRPMSGRTGTDRLLPRGTRRPRSPARNPAGGPRQGRGGDQPHGAFRALKTHACPWHTMRAWNVHDSTSTRR